ncbi:protein adenylyltransferase SelO family protein, partial [Francisella tularensis subsp. holarctica]|uniref:protein adenylyltransferase SelO family protein n=1 Tax=Francisella tularensis TaxID=263 RepID=UPI0023819C67
GESYRQELLDYTITRHKIPHNDNKALSLLDYVIAKQTSLITELERVGFIQGVMNTDNMTISGETIDYGPCAFMDSYDP